jgi:RNA polymerase sigma-70 factor (ECF subfamily)
MPFPSSRGESGSRSAAAAVDRSRALAALVHRARRGERRAFGLLWQQHAATVRAVVASVLPFRLVDDVVQDVALAAMAKIGTLRAEQGFAAWLCAIARNRARNVRSSRRSGGSADGVDMDALPAAPADAAASEADEILTQLRALPPTYREPLALRFLAGLSGPEIGDRLGMTHGSVRVNLCRGMKLLRARLSARASRPPQHR